MKNVASQPKIKVFFLTFYPPTPTMGGAMAFYRHFVERGEFEIFLATDDARVMQYKPPYPVLIFKQPTWLARLMQTRFFKWAHSYKHLVAGYSIPVEVLDAAEKFKPDFIFTIAGSWSWTATMAQQLARKLGVPLVGSFNDWFDFNLIIHPSLHDRLEKKFRAFYQDCDLAWCTCEGMRKELGSHPNAQILYPVGALPQSTERAITVPPKNPSRFVAVFAGNLGDWYGRMLEQLVAAAKAVQAPIEFRIYGANQSWSREFDQMARAENIYRGLLPFEQLRQEMAGVDALLLFMGFGEACALTERTSFKTKFLDYLTFQKPILLWGPDYCSASSYAKEFDSAEQCNSPDPKAFLKTLLDLKADPARQKALVENAGRMFQDRFHPDKIHGFFVQECRKLVKQSHATT